MSFLVNDHNHSQTSDILLHLPLHVYIVHGVGSFCWCFGFLVFIINASPSSLLHRLWLVNIFVDHGTFSCLYTIRVLTFALWQSLRPESHFIFSCRCWVQKHWTGKVWKVGKRFGVVQRERVYHSGTFFSWCYLFTDSAGIVREGSSSIYLSLLQHIFCTLCWWSNDWEEGKQLVFNLKEKCPYFFMLHDNFCMDGAIFVAPCLAVGLIWYLVLFDVCTQVNLEVSSLFPQESPSVYWLWLSFIFLYIRINLGDIHVYAIH